MNFGGPKSLNDWNGFGEADEIQMGDATEQASVYRL